MTSCPSASASSGQDRRVGVGLVLARLRTGERRAGEQPEHPRGIGFGDGEARHAAAPQRRRYLPGVVEQLAVGRRALRRDDRRPLGGVNRGRLEESDHSVRTAA